MTEKIDDGGPAYPVPPPDAIVRYADGSFAPIMFHYAAEGCKPGEIAAENGFDLHLVEMENVLPDDDPIMVAYFEDGDASAFRKWAPPEIDGWHLVGKQQAEDGPVAIYIRKRATPVSDTGGDT